MSRKQVCIALLLSLSAASVASGTTIYGGPTYDSSAGAGYQSPALPYAPGATAGGGVGVGYATRWVAGSSKGNRAVRWDTSGMAVELGNLGTGFDGSTTTEAYAVNTAGTAVGYSEKFYLAGSWSYVAVRWDASGKATALENLWFYSAMGISYSYAYAINDAGTAVGWANKFIGIRGVSWVGTRAVRWDASGAATELGNLGTDSYESTDSAAYAINAAGTAVGSATKYISGSPYGDRAVRWDAAGTAATELENLGTDSNGSTSSYAYAVNDAGTAVGRTYKYVAGSNKGWRATRWVGSNTMVTELGNLGTDSGGNTNSYAYDVNATGAVVGYADKYVSGNFKGYGAVRWNAVGTTTELGNLGTDSSGNTDSKAFALNDAGTAVGYATQYDALGSGQKRAVMWGQDGVAIDLSTLLDPGSGWLYLSEADSITNGNWITGIGRFDPDGAGSLDAYDRAFLIQIPEPSVMGLLAGGGLMLLSPRRGVVRR